MKAAKVFIVLLTAFIVVIFTDCSSAENKETEEIITGIISAGNNRVEYN